MIAKIAVSAAIYAIDKPYDYRVPDGLSISVGLRVSVPFGRANKRCEGVVLALTQGDESKLKPVLETLEEQPLLDERMLHTAAFLRERYFCTFYDAVKAILPAGVWFQEKESYEIVNADWQTAIARQPVAKSVMQTIAELGGSAEIPFRLAEFAELLKPELGMSLLVFRRF